MRRWYLIHTKPASESVAKANLTRQGYEVYLPLLAQPVRRGRSLRERIAALFPRYLFLHLSEGHEALGPVRSSVGVAGIVRFGASFAVVPDQVVQSLQQRADAVSGLHRLSELTHLRAGVNVRITDGPFDGLEGVFQRESGGDRVIVLLKLLGQETSVRLPAWSVRSAQAAYGYA